MKVRIAIVMAVCCLALSQAHAESLAHADPSQRPNILFIIADDLSAEALGCYGNDQVHTPNIDALAARGVRFERAYTQYPVCGPARAALMSGLYPQQNGVTHNDSRDTLTDALGDHPTLPQHFKNHGYTTARVGKIYHMGVPGDITAGASGADHAASWTEAYNIQAPEQWTAGVSYMLSSERLKPDPDRDIHYGLGYGTAFFCVEDPTDGAEQHDVKATDKAIELMGKYKASDQPFFLAVGYVRPHVPLVAPKSFFDLYDADELTLPEQVENDLADIPRLGWNRLGSQSGTDTDEKRRAVLRAYYASVSFMDAQVGRLLNELDERGLTDNTIVVFLSDHGYHLGEHDMWQKMSLHEESVRIPLLFAGPDVGVGLRNEGMIESVDVFPSLASLTGLPIPERCVGMDLTNVGAEARDYAYSLCHAGHLIRTKDWAYIRYNDGTEELYNMKDDPHQFFNLLAIKHPVNTAQPLRERLEVVLKTMQP